MTFDSTSFLSHSQDEFCCVSVSRTSTMSEPAGPTVAVESETALADADPSGPSKSELKKRAKEAEKAKKASERVAREEEEKKKREAAASVDNATQNYGKLPLHQSQERTSRFDRSQSGLG